VEAEGAGDDGGGDLQDELTKRGDPGGAKRQAQVAELGGDGAVIGGLPACMNTLASWAACSSLRRTSLAAR